PGSASSTLATLEMRVSPSPTTSPPTSAATSRRVIVVCLFSSEDVMTLLDGALPPLLAERLRGQGRRIGIGRAAAGLADKLPALLTRDLLHGLLRVGAYGVDEAYPVGLPFGALARQNAVPVGPDSSRRGGQRDRLRQFQRRRARIGRRKRRLPQRRDRT